MTRMSSSAFEAAVAEPTATDAEGAVDGAAVGAEGGGDAEGGADAEGVVDAVAVGAEGAAETQGTAKGTASE